MHKSKKTYKFGIYSTKKKRGFYIDIGCSDWKEDSISYFFYELGWRGICIDVQQKYQQGFDSHRPQDTFICAGVSDTNQEYTLYDSGGRLSTFVPDHLKFLLQKGVFPTGFEFAKRKIQTKPLAEILVPHPIIDIDFTCIDVEGFEFKVLQGNNWEKHRPNLIILEATQPCNLAVRTDGPCTKLLQKQGYTPILFDGINRYYRKKR